jgi:cytochrome c-type biogenesis protein CcsB
MVVNETLAQVSDLAFEAAMAAYLSALVCYGIEFAAGRSIPPTAAEMTSARLRETASGGVGVLRRTGNDPAGHDMGGLIGAVARARKPLWGGLFGRSAAVLTVVGFTAQLISLITRGLAAGRAPWGNMYEFASMITAAAVGAWLIVLIRTRARSIGFFVMLPVAILVFIAGTVLYVPATQLVPALQSYWLVIHVLAVSLSSGVLMLSGAASVVYLLRARLERRLNTMAYVPSAGDNTDPARPVMIADIRADTSGGRSLLAGLPSLDTLDRIAYRTAIVAFPVFTFAVMAGAMWAEAAWGRYWGWDPKETTAFITWVVYAGYLHARATAGWRGRRAAWISVIGFACILFNLFFVNMVVSGLHSYAGLN